MLEGRAAELAAAVPEEFRDVKVLAAAINSLKSEYDSLTKKIKAARECFEVRKTCFFRYRNG